jgi:hypothetical protein
MIAATFVGLTSAQLATLQTETLAAISGILGGAQSYSMAGRSFTKADLGQLRTTLQEINYAIQHTDGTLVRNVHNDMSNP